MSIADVKKLVGDKKLVVGTEATTKNIKNGKVKKVFLSSNCPKNIKEDIMHYAKIFGSEVEVLDVNNEDLGVACKKPFSVSVLSLLK